MIRLTRLAVFSAINFISRPVQIIETKWRPPPNLAGIVDLTKNCPSGQLPPTAVAVSVLSIGQFCGGKDGTAHLCYCFRFGYGFDRFRGLTVRDAGWKDVLHRLCWRFQF